MVTGRRPGAVRSQQRPWPQLVQLHTAAAARTGRPRVTCGWYRDPGLGGAVYLLSSPVAPPGGRELRLLGAMT